MVVSDFNRVQVYNASYKWNAKDFDLKGFYRTGHYHWGYEGDFFALYSEANYGPNLDTYNGETLGFEVDGRGSLNGFKAAFGPQLWWGANPAVLLKYGRNLGNWGVAAVYHEDIDDVGRAVTSIAIPLPKIKLVTKKAPSSSVVFLPSKKPNTKPNTKPSGKPFKNIHKILYGAGTIAKSNNDNHAIPIHIII